MPEKLTERVIEWEELTGYGGPSVRRAQVPGGWLVFAQVGEPREGTPSIGLCFMPDSAHEWTPPEREKAPPGKMTFVPSQRGR